MQVELKKEKDLDQLRRRFVAQVSHELKTPISVITSYLDALVDGMIEDKEVEDAYHLLLDESDKMSQIISDLLDLSQLESGQMKVKKEGLHLDKLVEKIVHKHQQIIKKQGLVLDIIALDPLVVNGDQLRLEQAIGNLFSNAIKHAATCIEVNLKQEDTGFSLHIINNGHLIEERDLDHIWESFYKGRNPEIQGTGLGLAIASHIFDLHKMTYEARNHMDTRKVEFIIKGERDK